MSRRILHLVGSPVSTAWDELSRLYAAGALAALGPPGSAPDAAGPLIARVEPGGNWSFPMSLHPADLAAAPRLTAPAAVARLGSLGIDVMVPHLFCLPGMTHYRALFDVVGIPYVGNAPETMWLGARKDLARAAVAAAGVAVPPGELLSPGRRPRAALPLVIKPVAADNSDGVALVRTEAELDQALEDAFSHGHEVLAEAFIPPGREVRCGVLERAGELTVLPLEEYPVAPGRPIRTRVDKLGRSVDGALSLVAKGPGRAWIVERDDPIVVRVGAAARTAHRALGCRHYSLFDFRVDPAGRPWFLEAGLYCSFSPQSVISTMAAAAGLSLPDLFTAMVAEAVAAPHPTRSERSAA